MVKASDLVQKARELSDQVPTWADLSNALFDPFVGLLARAFPTRETRAAFVKTEEYRQINALIAEAQQRFGLVEGATPQNLGPCLIPLPVTLYAALERQAAAAGVSIDELVIARLSLAEPHLGQAG